MTPVGWLTAAVRLARPAQWPILTAQFALAVLLAGPGPESGFAAWAHGLAPASLLGGWAAWVVLLNGGTLAFNSAYDRDTGPVAYLAAPPVPPPGLAPFALAAMAAGVVLGARAVGPFFAAVTAGCVLLSVAYSHPAVRLKARPGWDLAVNMVGYGAGTTAAGLATGGGGPTGPGWGFVAGFGLLFGSFYPLTQIYQAADDSARGDRTLATALGTRRALALALGLGLAAAGVLGGALVGAERTAAWWVPAAALGLWCLHVAWWRARAARWNAARHERGMYTALGLWALIDVALAWAWLAG
ncbi:UbiA family prenyltransferase [bacterium]|nr:UbiA family prenyltransferase [bacterium]